MIGKDRAVVRQSLSRYAQATRPQAGLFAADVVASVALIGLVSFANPYIVARIVDRISAGGVGPDEVLGVFGPAIAALVLVNVAGQFASKFVNWATWKLQIGANYRLATLCFDTLSNQSMTFHSDQLGGSLVSQTTRFMNAYALILEEVIYSVVPILCSAVFTLVILAPVVPAYVAILFILVVAYVVLAYWMYEKLLPLNRDASGAYNRLFGALSDSMTNILAVKTYGREGYERALFDDANDQVLDTDSQRMRASTLRGVAVAAIIVAMTTALAFFVAGGNAWLGIAPGTIVMMFSYTYTLTTQFDRIGMMFQQLNRAFGDAHEMTKILGEPLLVSDAPDATELVVGAGKIDFRGLVFDYRTSNDQGDVGATRVFDGIDLAIPAGQRVGVVGRSGAGKTTLVKLLLRLADVQGGSILVDGQDVSRVTQHSLRSQIAYVPQDPLLFHRSIRENIAYGRPDATDAEVREAAKRAHALEFIEQLPDGFETHVGEMGGKLSGGQRQRIAIARAILADAPILVLDEATSALDSESEALVSDAVANLMAGRTSIVVAHRLSTVAMLDRIVVIDGGTIAEDGTHEALLAQGGIYAGMWNRQSGAFLGKH